MSLFLPMIGNTNISDLRENVISFIQLDPVDSLDHYAVLTEAHVRVMREKVVTITNWL